MHRGRRLQSAKGLRTRPTSDLLRQAMFNVVEARVQGARVLDVFAGTGAVGLEALSRGAAAATFLERDRHALASLRSNLASLDLGSRARVIAGDALVALAGLAAAGEAFDCIFVDPPYGGDLALRCVEVLAPGRLLSENALLVVQAFHKNALPARIETLSRWWDRRYGETRLTVYRKESACP
jgi:16S rRNA (guanine(966)-N(2))-methyltransferase RsmD